MSETLETVEVRYFVNDIERSKEYYEQVERNTFHMHNSVTCKDGNILHYIYTQGI